jgi:16S rRNA (uracil1498-N3)-methyltransferase
MPKKLNRLYVSAHFRKGALLPLQENQSHYLLHVLRAREGDSIIVFNGEDGNWLAQMRIIKKTAHLDLVESMVSMPPLPCLHLYFSPIKKHRLSWLIEKATELGVTDFHPILTERTTQPLPSIDKLSLIAIEASEQSERVEVPHFHPPLPFAELLDTFDLTQTLLVGHEDRTHPPLSSLPLDGNTSMHLLVGPEGGFSPREFEAMGAYAFVRFVTLSKMILRTETAALAGLSLLQLTEIS